MSAPLSERDRERAPEALFTRDADGAAVQGDELFREREPDPRSGLRAGGPGAVEPVEDEIEVGRRDSGAAVPNRYARGAVVASHRHADGAAVGCELEGVREQVRERALELTRVRVYDGVVGRALDLVGDGLSLRQRHERAGDAGDECAELHASRMQYLSPRLDARELEDLVDQVEHAF